MSAPLRTQWTPERDQTLRDLAAAGASAEDIAAEMGVTRSAVWTRANRLGVRTGGFVTEAQRDAILHRHSQRWRPSRIAIQVGVEVGVIMKVIERYAPKPAPAVAPPPVIIAPTPPAEEPAAELSPHEQRRERIRILHSRGLKSGQIALRVGRSPGAVYSMLKGMGLAPRRTYAATGETA